MRRSTESGSVMDKEGAIMKILVYTQRILALVAMIVGAILMFSEVPLGQGLSAQAWLSVGGFCIVLLSIAWLWIASKEEGIFIHETR